MKTSKSAVGKGSSILSGFYFSKHGIAKSGKRAGESQAATALQEFYAPLRKAEKEAQTKMQEKEYLWRYIGVNEPFPDASKLDGRKLGVPLNSHNWHSASQSPNSLSNILGSTQVQFSASLSYKTPSKIIPFRQAKEWNASARSPGTEKRNAGTRREERKRKRRGERGRIRLCPQKVEAPSYYDEIANMTTEVAFHAVAEIDAPPHVLPSIERKLGQTHPKQVNAPPIHARISDSNLKLVKLILLREEYVQLIRKLIFKTTRENQRDVAFAVRLLNLVDKIRNISVDVVENSSAASGPCIWQGYNYMLKMITDLDFIRWSSVTEHLHGITIRRNPFFMPLNLDALNETLHRQYDAARIKTCALHGLRGITDFEARVYEAMIIMLSEEKLHGKHIWDEHQKELLACEANSVGVPFASEVHPEESSMMETCVAEARDIVSGRGKGCWSGDNKRYILPLNSFVQRRAAELFEKHQKRIAAEAAEEHMLELIQNISARIITGCVARYGRMRRKEKRKAVITMQKCVRIRQARRCIRETIEERKQEALSNRIVVWVKEATPHAIVIQCMIRTIYAVRHVSVLRKRRMAIRLQAWARIFGPRKTLLWYLKARTIQCAVRFRTSRRILLQRRDARRRRLAATAMQSIARMKLGQKRWIQEFKSSKAIVIQCICRSILAKQARMRNLKARSIQAVWRGALVRMKKAHELHKQNLAMRITRWYRKWQEQARSRLYSLKIQAWPECDRASNVALHKNVLRKQMAWKQYDGILSNCKTTQKYQKLLSKRFPGKTKRANMIRIAISKCLKRQEDIAATYGSIQVKEMKRKHKQLGREIEALQKYDSDIRSIIHERVSKENLLKRWRGCTSASALKQLVLDLKEQRKIERVIMRTVMPGQDASFDAYATRQQANAMKAYRKAAALYVSNMRRHFMGERVRCVASTLQRRREAAELEKLLDVELPLIEAEDKRSHVLRPWLTATPSQIRSIAAALKPYQDKRGCIKPSHIHLLAFELGLTMSEEKAKEVMEAFPRNKSSMITAESFTIWWLCSSSSYQDARIGMRSKVLKAKLHARLCFRKARYVAVNAIPILYAKKAEYAERYRRWRMTEEEKKKEERREINKKITDEIERKRQREKQNRMLDRHVDITKNEASRERREEIAQKKSIAANKEKVEKAISNASLRSSDENTGTSSRASAAQKAAQESLHIAKTRMKQTRESKQKKKSREERTKTVKSRERRMQRMKRMASKR